MKNQMTKLINGSIIMILLLTGAHATGQVQASPPTVDFSAAPTEGVAPLVVQFTDQSADSPVGWAWYFGNETLAADWQKLPDSVRWSGRVGHTSVVLPDGRIVVMAGDGGTYKNDVWASDDGGETWNVLTENAGWSAREFLSSVVLPNGQIVLMGGRDSSGWKDDIWRSEDGGTTWQVVTAGERWSARAGHSTVVLPDGSIVLMGGKDGNNKNDVWRSDDGGISWTKVTENAGWSTRSNHTSLVLPGGRIVVMGGDDSSFMDDVWRSDDGGLTWHEVTANAGWSARAYHTSVVLPNGRIVLAGGWADSGFTNDVWSSDNGGATWTKMADYVGWSARAGHTSTVLPDGRIVLMGGLDDSNFRSDIWRRGTAGSNEQNPQHTYTETGIYPVTLQVFNAEGVSKISKQAFIQVLPVLAEFSAAPTVGIAPLTVQFVDQSDGEPTGWAWYFGDEVLSADWEDVTDDAGWSKRVGHSSVVLPDGRIMLMGGFDEDLNRNNDVWDSMDGGATWEVVTTNADWSKRERHSSVVLPDGRIVLMGGWDESSNKNDVWVSQGGGTWQALTPAADWSARSGHSSVVLPDGQIVLMGGWDGTAGPGSRKNDVWTSADGGATWELTTENAGWSERWGHSSVVLPSGRIVLMGGYDFANNRKNDVWESADGGATWQVLSESAEWPARRLHSSVVLPDGRIVLMGGDFGIISVSDVWYSANGGVTWTQVTDSAGWSVRDWHTSVVLPDGRIVLMGGRGDEEFNDVWRLSTAGSHQQNPGHTYAETGTYNVTLQVFNDTGAGKLIKSGYIEVLSVLAGFSAVPTSGVAPLTVNFFNESEGESYTCEWDFGDGSTSTDCDDPSHVFDAAGTYTVSLTIRGDGDEVDTETKSNYIEVFSEVDPGDDLNVYLPLVLK